MTNTVELAITVGILLAELGLFAFCYHQAKQPPNPAKPRLINYGLVMLILTLLFLATLAHVVSLVTGKQVEPRRRRGL
jgi:hypothetical protein